MWNECTSLFKDYVGKPCCSMAINLFDLHSLWRGRYIHSTTIINAVKFPKTGNSRLFHIPTFHLGGRRLLSDQQWKFWVLQCSIVSSVVESIGPDTKEGYCRCLIAHNAHFRALFTKNDIYGCISISFRKRSTQCNRTLSHFSIRIVPPLIFNLTFSGCGVLRVKISVF